VTVRVKRKLLLPFRLAWWTVTLQLRDRLRLRAQRRFVLESGLFDSSFYLQHNPDVAQAGMDPVEHYLTAADAAARQPHLLFDSNWYLVQNPDVAAAGQNPLLHYLHAGWREHRNPNPLFDIALYLEQNPDVAAANVEPLGQYLRSGAFEGRDPHPLFDTDFYLAQHPAGAALRTNPLAHYLAQGWRERLSPHPLLMLGSTCNAIRISPPPGPSRCSTTLLPLRPKNAIRIRYSTPTFICCRIPK
jgi:hypothetical protein